MRRLGGHSTDVTGTVWKLVAAGVLLLLVFIGPPPPAVEAENVVTILNNGDPANRVDLAVLGDGYTAAEMSKYATDVNTFIAGMFAQDPFKEYKPYFNVNRIDVISAESGADHPELNPQVFKNTALDATYNCNSIQRLICVDTTKAMTIAANNLPAVRRDMVLVIVNDPTYGGSGGSVAVASTNVSAVELILHELGHSFGLLADEYDYGPPSCATTEPPQANATRVTQRSAIKWAPWISPTTPLPTTSTQAAVPGLYEGAVYCATGAYRPTYNSKMRNLGLPYEQINTEQLIKRIYNLVSPLEAVSPPFDSFSLPSGNAQSFTASVTTPFSHALDVTWRVDGVQAGSGGQFVFNTQSVAPGLHSVEVLARDLTPMVRNDPQHLLEGRKTWCVSVTGPPPQSAAPLVVLTSCSNANSAPAFTSPAGATFSVGVTGSFTVTASGVPAPYLSLQAGDVLPNGVTFNPVTGVLTGVPEAGQAGTYTLHFTATNGVNPPATQTFILTVQSGGVPGGVRVANPTASSLDIFFDDTSSNETGFEIERKVQGGSYAFLAAFGALAGTQPGWYWPDTGLSSATTYCYRMRSKVGTTYSEYSNEACGTTGGVAGPAAPSAVTVGGITTNSLFVYFTDNTNNETGFEIERKIQGGSYAFLASFGALPGAQSGWYWPDSGLQPGTTYCYHLRTSVSPNFSGYSNEACGTTSGASGPAAPSAVSVGGVNATSLNVFFTDNATNETGFEIERKLGQSGTYAFLTSLGALQGAQAGWYWPNTGLSSGTTYCYRMRSKIGTTYSAYSNEACGTTSLEGPAAPSGVAVAGATSSSLTVYFNDNATTETGFAVERRTNGIWGPLRTFNALPGTQAGWFFTDTSLTPSSTYCYRLRAYNTMAQYSDYSNEGCGQTTP